MGFGFTAGLPENTASPKRGRRRAAGFTADVGQTLPSEAERAVGAALGVDPQRVHVTDGVDPQDAVAQAEVRRQMIARGLIGPTDHRWRESDWVLARPVDVARLRGEGDALAEAEAEARAAEERRAALPKPRPMSAERRARFDAALDVPD
jgi:hypothetical protein